MDDVEKQVIYISALEKVNSSEISVLQSAVAEFSSIIDYRDSGQRIVYCKEKINLLENAKEKKKSAKRLVILATLACIAVGAVALFINRMIQNKQLNELHIEHYNNAISYLNSNQYQEAALEFGKAGDYEDAQERSMMLWKKIIKPSVISVGTFTWNNFIVGLKSDGTVIATGRNSNGQCNVSDWDNIISVSAGFEHTVGLKSDGTVVAIGANNYGQCNVSKWKNIVKVVAGDQCTIGLQSDGSLLFTGFDANGEDECENWTDIVDIWIEGDSAIGKTLDGAIISSEDYFNYSDNDAWMNLKKISFSYDCGVLGLTQDNSVLFDNWGDTYGVTEVQHWTDVIDIDGGLRNAVGIKSDGTVVFAGSNEEGQNEISEWTNIVLIITEGRQTLGLKSDGTVLLVGDIGSWGIDVSEWEDIMIP